MATSDVKTTRHADDEDAAELRDLAQYLFTPQAVAVIAQAVRDRLADPHRPLGELAGPVRWFADRMVEALGGEDGYRLAVREAALEPAQDAAGRHTVLLVPDHEDDAERYPGGIRPGSYTMGQLVELLRQHANDPQAVYFLADMLE